MNLEKAVIELTDCINHAGLNEQIIEERKVYLCLIATILVHLAEHRRYDEFLSALFASPSTNSWHESLSQILDTTTFSNTSHRFLFQEVLERLATLSDEKRALLLSNTSHILSIEVLQKITKFDAITLYSHLLQRLQAISIDNKLAIGFPYQDIPSFFSDLMHRLVSNPRAHSIYDPYAMTGELAIYYALNTNIELVTTESLLQTSAYLSHMLCISGVADINAMQSYGLAPVPNISPEIADVAFTLLDPTTSRHDENIDAENNAGKKYTEHAFIKQILYALKNNGIGIIFLGKGPLHRESETNEREYLVNNNLVEAVIELPPKLITPRTISLYALVLKKNRNNKLIKFIDASTYFETVGRRNQLSKLDEICKLFNSNKSVSGSLSIQTTEDVLANGASLSPSSYLSNYQITNPVPDFEKVRKQLFIQMHDTDEKLNVVLSQLNQETNNT